MPYQPIENYGVIGDLRTAALVGKNGSLDWLCLPHFDSPSVFAALLDDVKGGRFQVEPTCEDVTHKQLYWPDTNILVTRFLGLVHFLGQIDQGLESCQGVRSCQKESASSGSIQWSSRSMR